MRNKKLKENKNEKNNFYGEKFKGSVEPIY